MELLGWWCQLLQPQFGATVLSSSLMSLPPGRPFRPLASQTTRSMVGRAPVLFPQRPYLLVGLVLALAKSVNFVTKAEEMTSSSSTSPRHPKCPRCMAFPLENSQRKQRYRDHVADINTNTPHARDLPLRSQKPFHYLHL